jgi:hypothetical protein
VCAELLQQGPDWGIFDGALDFRVRLQHLPAVASLKRLLNVSNRLAAIAEILINIGRGGKNIRVIRTERKRRSKR